MIQDTSLITYRNIVEPELTERQLAVYRVFLTGDYSMREVANILHVPEHTISGRGGELIKLGRLHRVRRKVNPNGNGEWVLSTNPQGRLF